MASDTRIAEAIKQLRGMRLSESELRVMYQRAVEHQHDGSAYAVIAIACAALLHGR